MSRMRQDDRGMSLIELIVAVSMAAIVMGAATIFIMSALRSYNTASAVIDLQMESHVLMEQLGAWIMEGNRVEIIDVGAGGGYTATALVIYSIPREVNVSNLPMGTEVDENGRVILSTAPPGATLTPATASKRVIWQDGDSLYMMETTGIMNADTDVTSLGSSDANRDHLISLYIEDLTYVWDKDQNTLTLTLKMRSGTEEYGLQNVILMRNEFNTPAPSPTTTP